jgi:hypothetical protein
MSNPPGEFGEADLLDRLNEAVFAHVEPREQPDLVADHGGLALSVARTFAGRMDELQRLTGDDGIDVHDWLMNLPFALATAGHVDQAAELSAALTELDPDNRNVYLADRAVLLAEAGREVDARAQIDANVAEFPDDVWVRILAGDALASLDDRVGAEAHLRAAAALAADQGDPDAGEAWNRLAELLAADPARADDVREARRMASGLGEGRSAPAEPHARGSADADADVSDGRSGATRRRGDKAGSRSKRKAARASRRRNRR